MSRCTCPCIVNFECARYGDSLRRSEELRHDVISLKLSNARAAQRSLDRLEADTHSRPNSAQSVRTSEARRCPRGSRRSDRFWRCWARASRRSSTRRSRRARMDAAWWNGGGQCMTKMNSSPQDKCWKEWEILRDCECGEILVLELCNMMSNHR